MVSTIAVAALRAYLGIFAFFAPNRDYARREHALLEGSLRDAYTQYRERGLAKTPAAFAALWDQLSEVWPLAVARKTLADAACVPGRDARYPLRLASGAGVLLAGGVGLFALLGLQAGGVSAPSHTVAQVFPSDDPRSGSVEVVAEADSFQEAIYIGTGGTICLSADFDPADLTDEILSTPSTPEELEACADYELPPSTESTEPETNRALETSD